ncbi:MAG: SDR family oxidoreductase [Candidatus Poseidoniia archaeon]|nr:SDR family oxidoreductase [Candidatus Poseidoniia archaeon]MDP6658138.1 SDR family oxidoreductase [Candidatus Poseidoniia archaeon]MDP6846495.1 SDR family oxidoreductase [Candidatus Poseidoniia archaeon]MDP7007122.1 SDR family oxidoreductase [Candidatus Poseidoniia archaeon]
MGESPFRDDLFAGARVLVTGGGTGMGLAFAQTFAAHGAQVAIASRNAEHLAAGAATVTDATGTEVLTHVVDVRDAESVAALAATLESEWGALDVLVNNAAGNFFAPVAEMSENAWRAVVDIVLDGTFRVSRAFHPLLRKGRDASVVNIVANYAWGAASYVAHSGAAKAGVLNLTRSLALEWASHGIRVNALCPGVVPTEGARANLFPAPEMEQMITDTIPKGRLATADEMALQVLWLAASDYVTGECLVADGGQWLAGNPFYTLGKLVAD